MTWERFCAAMGLLQQAYGITSGDNWAPTVRLWFGRLARYGERAVMAALHECPVTYRRRPPTLGQIDELCAKHARKLRVDTPALLDPRPTNDAQYRGERWAAYIVECLEQGRTAELAAIRPDDPLPANAPEPDGTTAADIVRRLTGQT